MSRPILRTVPILLAFVALGSSAVPMAYAVQASGSIQLIPSQQTDLAKDQEITVNVSFVNNSTKSPPDAVVPNAASLSGPITVDFTCLDASCDCSQKDSTRFSFVSCSTAGAPAGVLSCVDAGSGRAIINIAPGGVDLAASTAPVLLAQLRIKNNLAVLPFTRFRASTDVCALSSCLTIGRDCATCAAEGCSFARGPFPTNVLQGCKHTCLNRISFFNGLDKLHFNALVQAPGYDPATASFSLTLSQGGTIFQVTVPSIPLSGTRTWEIRGPGNSTTPGFSVITITKRTGTGAGGVDCSNDWFKIVVDGWGDLNAAQTKDPPIVSEVNLGTVPALTFINSQPWTSIPTGASGAGITAVQADFDPGSPC
jgi:hypothetical protein